MSWIEHYRQQAEAHRKEAHAWITHGKESRAQFHLDAAQVYDELAEEAEERALIRSEQR